MIELMPLLSIGLAIVLGTSGRRGGQIPALFGLALLIAYAVESFAIVFREMGWHNVILYNLYTLLEFVLLLGYGLRIGRGSRDLPWFLGGCLAFIFIWLKDTGFGRTLNEEIATTAFVASALVLVPVHAWRLFSLADGAERSILTNGDFWASLSIVLYCGCMIPGVGLHRYLQARDSELASEVVTIFQLLAVVRYGVACIASCQWRRLVPV